MFFGRRDDFSVTPHPNPINPFNYRTGTYSFIPNFRGKCIEKLLEKQPLVYLESSQSFYFSKNTFVPKTFKASFGFYLYESFRLSPE